MLEYINVVHTSCMLLCLQCITRYVLVCTPMMYVHQVCIGMYTHDVCSDLQNGTYSDEEDVVQGETAVWMLYEHVCFEVPSLFLSFFYGPLR